MPNGLPNLFKNIVNNVDSLPLVAKAVVLAKDTNFQRPKEDLVTNAGNVRTRFVN
jgi:hypothetical protein